MSLESLPNELLLNLFEFLTCPRLLHAFIGLNARFDTLLLVYIQEHSLDFQSMYKQDFDIICQRYLPSIIDRIISLCLSDDNETPQQTHLFLRYNFTLRQFSSLRTLSLCNISSEETIIEMMLTCHHIPHLAQLKLIGFTFRSGNVTRFQCMIDSIWSLSKLIYCKLNANLEYGSYSLAPTVISTSLKQLFLSGIEPRLNPTNYLFDYTPRLRTFSSSITLRPHYVFSSYDILSITKLNVCFSSPSTQYTIEEFLQSMSNLSEMTVRIHFLSVNGYAWEQIIRDHLSKLKVFQLKMEIKIHDVNNKETEIDALVDSFRSQFWLEDHGWFVRCDWIPDKQYTSIFLYTLPHAFTRFVFNVPILFKSTSPHKDKHYTYNYVRNLECNTALVGDLSLCHVKFNNIRYLSIKLPINDQFWSIVPRFDKLISLNVLLDDNNDSGQSQLHSLLGRAPRLQSLKIKSCLSSTKQIVFTEESINLSNLQLFSQGFSQCFYHEACIVLNASSLGMQCEILEIAVHNRENILTLIKGMSKLRALYVYCRDDKRNGNFERTNDELIQWLQQRLPSTCVISRHEHLFYIIRIWIG